MSAATIRVARLSVAPVKALGVLHPDRIRLDVDGVAEDRRVFLLDARGAVVTLRRFPRLGGVRPALDLPGAHLAVTLPDGTAVAQDLAPSGPEVRASLFGKERGGRLVPGAVGEALSALAGEPLRLVLAERPGVGWDEGPVSLVGSASVAAVGTPADTADRYRMLIELETAEPFVEDGWVGSPVRVGAAVVAVTHALERCVVVNRDPRSGRGDWPGLRTLAERRGRDALTLGVIATVLAPRPVRVGDAVEPPRGRTG